MKLFLSILLLGFIVLVDSCKKSCNFPEYQYNNICYPNIGYKYVGDYHGTDSSAQGSQNLFHRVTVGTKYPNSIVISQLAPDAEVDEQGNFVVDTQQFVINGSGFTVFGSGYFSDSASNELLIANIHFIADSDLPSSYLHFRGMR